MFSPMHFTERWRIVFCSEHITKFISYGKIVHSKEIVAREQLYFYQGRCRVRMAEILTRMIKVKLIFCDKLLFLFVVFFVKAILRQNDHPRDTCKNRYRLDLFFFLSISDLNVINKVMCRKTGIFVPVCVLQTLLRQGTEQ